MENLFILISVLGSRSVINNVSSETEFIVIVIRDTGEVLCKARLCWGLLRENKTLGEWGDKRILRIGY